MLNAKFALLVSSYLTFYPYNNLFDNPHHYLC